MKNIFWLFFIASAINASDISRYSFEQGQNENPVKSITLPEWNYLTKVFNEIQDDDSKFILENFKVDRDDTGQIILIPKNEQAREYLEKNQKLSYEEYLEELQNPFSVQKIGDFLNENHSGSVLEFYWNIWTHMVITVESVRGAILAKSRSSSGSYNVDETLRALFYSGLPKKIHEFSGDNSLPTKYSGKNMQDQQFGKIPQRESDIYGKDKFKLMRDISDIFSIYFPDLNQYFKLNWFEVDHSSITISKNLADEFFTSLDNRDFEFLTKYYSIFKTIILYAQMHRLFDDDEFQKTYEKNIEHRNYLFTLLPENWYEQYPYGTMYFFINQFWRIAKEPTALTNTEKVYNKFMMKITIEEYQNKRHSVGYDRVFQ